MIGNIAVNEGLLDDVMHIHSQMLHHPFTDQLNVNQILVEYTIEYMYISNRKNMHPQAEASPS